MNDFLIIGLDGCDGSCALFPKNEGAGMIEFLTEGSLDFVNCIECKGDVRPKFGSLAHLNSLQSLKNITNGRHQELVYSRKTCHLITI